MIFLITFEVFQAKRVQTLNGPNARLHLALETQLVGSANQPRYVH